MKKIIGFLVAIAFLGTTVGPVFAVTSTTTASASVQAYIDQLQILRQLQQGMSGDDIRQLQAILASQPDIYPERLITGFFGQLTAKAVAKFQKKYGLETVGRVGPKTLKKLREFMDDSPVSLEDSGDGRHNKPCAIVPPGHLIAPGWLKKIDREDGLNKGKGNDDNDENDESGNGRGNIRQLLTLPPCQKLPPGIAAKLGWPIGTSTNGTTTVMTAPVITSIVSTSTNATNTQITWTTNQYATTKVIYGTSTPILSATTTSTVSPGGYVLAHVANLTGLSTSTTYYYVVWSANIYGKVATSSELSFTTPAQ